MIIAIDIGGTKTYLAVFAQNGKLLKEVKFSTDKNYDVFLNDLEHYGKQIEASKAKVVVAAVPGLLDRDKGMVLSLGNLPWQDKYIRLDISKHLGVQTVFIENDSKLAGLAEARRIFPDYKRVFYLTLSTGIGGALIVDGRLSSELQDMEIGKMPLEFEGKIQQWEEFASGRSFFDRYGKKAIDVDDPKVWKEFSKAVNLGLGVVCSSFQVEAIVFGGGLGQHLSRFKSHLETYLAQNLHPIVRPPQSLISTHYRGQSVVYGCYQYAKDQLA